MMRPISDAVVLMAGTGSRLRASGETLPKPLVPIFGRPLISYIIDALQKVGVRNLHVVVGANGDALVEALRPLVPSPHALEYDSESGVAKTERHLRALRRREGKRAIFPHDGRSSFRSFGSERVAESADPSELNLAIDRKIEAIFDLDDAMKVQTTGIG